MTATPRTASVVIPCFNYRRFVASAIESALGQTRAFREVIVVDDGSTDDSREVIQGYGDRVRAVFKPNGGHASAFNAGFALSRGDVVFILDADDELRPEAVETVLDAWRPDTVLFQSRPSLMDEEGRDAPGRVPPPWTRLSEGDLRGHMLDTGGIVLTVTSGLVFRRDVLQRILPIPEERFRYAAEGYLARAIAFHGKVQALDRSLSRYRRHGHNDSEMGTSRQQITRTVRRRLTFARNELETIRAAARQHGLRASDDLGERDPDLLFLRLASLALDPAGHPVPGDRRLALLSRMFAAAWAAPPGTTGGARILILATALTLLPRRLGFSPLAWFLSPATRPPWVSRLAAWQRHLRSS
jgi:GT2 family glycosyltransferase